MWSLTRPFRPPWQPFEHHSYDGRRCPCGWCKRDSAVASQSVMMAARSGTRSTEDLVRRVFRGRPFTMLDAQGHGLTRAQVRAAISAGRFTPLRRGVVIATADLQAMSLQARHLAVAHAQLLVRNADSVLSHHSARVLHSLPSPVPDEAIPASVFITCSMTGARSFGVTVVRAELTAEDISLVGRLRATSIPRTAIDTCRGQSLARSLVILDAALRRSGLNGDDLRAALDRSSNRRHAASLVRAIDLASDLSESPLESASRGLFIEAGLPTPKLQVWVTGDDGRSYRADMAWAEHRVIGEADGWGKYADIADLRKEKQREDALRAAGWAIVRWTSDEVWRNPYPLIDRLGRALQRGAPR